MYVIRVRLTVKPSGKELLVSHLQDEARRNRTLDGCEAYTLYKDASDTTSYLLYEEWRDVAAFNAYKNSDTFKQSMEKLLPLMSHPPDSVYYDARVVGP